MRASPNDDVPELRIEDQASDIVELLRTLKTAILSHPEAARALFEALCAEGELFAQTATGRRWQQTLASSELLRRAVLTFQAATLWATEEANATTPSAIIDALVAASRSPGRDALLQQLFASADLGD